MLSIKCIKILFIGNNVRLLQFVFIFRRTVWKNKFEMTYVGPSQVLVKPINNDTEIQTMNGVILKSQYGHEIEDVRVMGEDRYLIGRTRDTLLLGKKYILHYIA